MQYGCFRFLVAFAAIMGILHMIYENTYDYVFFPIIIIFWVIYTFFDENDQEYIRRNPFSEDDIAWLNNGTTYKPQATQTTTSTRQHTSQRTYDNWSSSYHERYMPQTQAFKDNYLSTKCKRSVKITVNSK